MGREIPYPMPVSMRDSVNVSLRGKDLTVLDENGRYTIRRLVAEAYALGHLDGRCEESDNQSTDRAIERDKGQAA